MKLRTLFAVATSLTVAAPALAGPIFVGSWTVDQGPWWPDSPTAYSGQGAAALLFGGSASDYIISTADDQVADINHLTWVSTYGGACAGAYPCGTQVAESFVKSTGGLYLNGGDTSAYVVDWAIGQQYRNYAFRMSAAPEPASWAMMLGGFGLLGGTMRARRKASAIA